MEGNIVINPVIVRHTRHTSQKKEGCLSFCIYEPVTVERWNKIELSYRTIEDGKLTGFRRVGLSGKDAQIAQHEIDHMNGKTVYDFLITK